MSNSNKNLVMGPRWGPDTKTNWATDRRSQYNFNFNFNLPRDVPYLHAKFGQNKWKGVEMYKE
jgi:hypothetical protein